MNWPPQTSGVSVLGTILIVMAPGCSDGPPGDSGATGKSSAPTPSSVAMSTTEPSRLDPSLLPDGTATCDVDGYTLGVHPEAGVFLVRDNKALFSHVGNSRFVWDRGLPIVSLDDQSNDGVVDRLVYSIYQNDSATHTTVIDRGFDGQADIRVVSDHEAQELSKWVWVESGWYETLRTERTTVLVDGKPRRYKLENERYVFESP